MLYLARRTSKLAFGQGGRESGDGGGGNRDVIAQPKLPTPASEFVSLPVRDVGSSTLTRETEALMGLRVHFLPLGDEAGPAPAPYALFGVDLEHDVSRRPSGWEDELRFDGKVMAGLRSPLTMWLIEGGDLNIVVDTGCSHGRPDTDAALERNAIWTEHRPEWTVKAQLKTVGLTPADVDVVVNTCCHFDHIGNNTEFPTSDFLRTTLGVLPRDPASALGAVLLPGILLQPAGHPRSPGAP